MNPFPVYFPQSCSLPAEQSCLSDVGSRYCWCQLMLKLLQGETLLPLQTKSLLHIMPVAFFLVSLTMTMNNDTDICWKINMNIKSLTCYESAHTVLALLYVLYIVRLNNALNTLKVNLWYYYKQLALHLTIFLIVINVDRSGFASWTYIMSFSKVQFKPICWVHKVKSTA